MKKPSECFHMMLERFKHKDEKRTIDVKDGMLMVPVFMCGDCGTLFYAIASADQQMKQTG